MRKLALSLLLTSFAYLLFAQAPQSFSYQAVVRDNSGNLIENQTVALRISIQQSAAFTDVYVETHSAITNNFGLVNLSIGSGIAVSGDFSSIDWGSDVTYLKVEIDTNGGSNYQNMGVSQLLSVPYALYAENSPESFWKKNVTDIYYDEGNVGVGTVSPNSKLQVNSDATAGINDVIFSVLNAKGDTVFAVYQEGVRIYVDDSGGSKANGNRGGFAVGGINPTKAGFTNEFFRVTPDSVRVYINDDFVASKANGNRGGFAVGGFSPSKGTATDHYLFVQDDSTRIYTGDTISGFGVENLNIGSSTSYMQITPSNYFIGYEAGSSNINGTYNSFLGYQAGKSNTNGNMNVFVGYQTGLNNLIGTENTAIGTNALLSNTNGNWNTATGSQCLHSNLGGIENVATGDYALYANLSGNGNSGFGSMALYQNVNGSDNSGFGRYVLWNNSNGNNNSAFGSFALYANQSGSENSGFGRWALYSNVVGAYNSAYGSNALYNNVSGNNNIAIGYQALYSNINGNFNTALGTNSLHSNDGINNTAIGYYALFSNTTGTENVAAGSNSLPSNTTGSYNVAYGKNSLQSNVTGDNNCAFGNDAYFAPNNLSNTISIGYFSGLFGSVSNRAEIGNSSMSWIGGQVAWSTFSNERIKENIEENVPGIEFIMRLRPVTYNLNIHNQNNMSYKKGINDVDWDGKYDIEKIRMTGFLAQEVSKAAAEIGYDFSGVEIPKDKSGLYSLRYSDFTVPLVKAVQEQQEIIEELKQENKNLKEENIQFAKRLEKLEELLK